MATPPEKLAQSLKALQDKGWYILSRPEEPTGESTAWYASYWNFCASYMNQRFNDEWYLSPEQSLLLHADNWTVPKQLLIHSLKGGQPPIDLCTTNAAILSP